MTNDTADFRTCGSYGGPPDNELDDKHIITCEAVGRYVRIQRGDGDGLMTLCEVMVHGYIYNGAEGKYFKDCVTEYITAS